LPFCAGKVWLRLLSIEIGGVDRTANLYHGSLLVSTAINARSVASVDLISEDGAYRPEVGEKFEVYDGATLIFSGTIDDLPEETLSGTSAIKFAGVPAVDHHQIADRILVAEAYEGEAAGDIVTDIITKYLTLDGITAGTIQSGITVSKAVFNYIPVSDCMDELSELTGFQWQINPDKTLDFFDRATYTGAALTEASDVNKIKVKRSRDQYRNRQYLRAGQDIAAETTLTFKGDGATQVFSLSLPAALEPTIAVNGTPRTVGIRGLETGFDWYWQKNDKSISQELTADKLISTDTLSVTYRGYYPILIVADNTANIADRVSVEGGSGIYESMVKKTSIDTKEAALEYTSGLLRRYGDLQKTVTVDSFVPYSAGQLVLVTLPSHDVNEQMLVSDVNISTVGASDDMRVLYKVKLVSGEAFGGWVNFFKKLTDSGADTIRENEVVIKLIILSDTFHLPVFTDSMTYTLHQYLICGTETICGTGVII